MTNRSVEYGIRFAADGRAVVVEAGRVRDSVGDIGKSADQANRKVEQSAKQTAFAMRMLPAQMSDIAVGLSTGQSPFMVLMQQGGQLKDMFGGIGPAARALGGYVAGLVNPFTIAAAAAVALATAYYQGSREADEYAKAIAASGNAAGVTTVQLNGMAAAIAASTGVTQNTAAAAVAALVASGRVAADNIQHVGQAAVAAERVLGTAIEDTVKQFEALGKSPVDASLKLTDQYRYLTAAVYLQIKALQDQGRTEEATTVAQAAWANELIDRSRKIEERLGVMERAWRDMGQEAAKAWDKVMRDIGREGDPLAAAQKSVDNLRRRLAEATDPKAVAQDPYGRQAEAVTLRAQLADAERELNLERARDKKKTGDAEKEAASRRDNEQAIGFYRDVDQYLSKQAQQKRAIAQLDQGYFAAVRAAAGDQEKILAATAKYRQGLTGIQNRYHEDFKQSPAFLEAQRKALGPGTDNRSATEIMRELHAQDAAEQKNLEDYGRAVSALLGPLESQARQLETSNANFGKTNVEIERGTIAMLEEARAIAAANGAWQDHLSVLDRDIDLRKRIAAASEQARLNSLLEATPDYKIEQSRKDMLLLTEALERGKIGERQYLDAVTQRLDLAGKKTEELSGFARDMGLSFTSSFEDALVKGAKFRDLLSAIGQDIGRIALRKLATEPAGNAVASAVQSGMDWLKGLFGGGRAAGGPVDPGRFYRVNENSPELLTVGGDTFLMMGARGGHVTPAAAGGGAGAAPVVIHQTINIDSRSDAATIRLAMVQAKNEAIAAIGSMRIRGTLA